MTEYEKEALSDISYVKLFESNIGKDQFQFRTIFSIYMPGPGSDDVPEDEAAEGLGQLPHDLTSISSLLLFNSGKDQLF